MLIGEKVLHIPSPKGCVIFLPGREDAPEPDEGMYAYLLQYLNQMGLEKYVVEILVPNRNSWYPVPKPNQMDDTLCGIDDAVQEVESILKRIAMVYKVPRERTVLVGFSAGAVMALQLGIRSNKTFIEKASSNRSFAGVLAFSGAAFNLEQFPAVEHRKETKFHLFHNMDDDVFTWEQRFIPIRDMLKKRGFQVAVHTHDVGGHKMPIDKKSLQHIGTIVNKIMQTTPNIPED